VLADTEALLCCHGCTAEKGALEEERTRAELARVREQMLALFLQAFYSGEPQAVWGAPESEMRH
jgi:hypothetical protein